MGNSAAILIARPSNGSRRAARARWPQLTASVLRVMQDLADRYGFDVAHGDLLYLDHGWYVTHSGLLGLATRKNCAGIEVRPVIELSESAARRFVFVATVFPTRNSKGFSGFGDAEPANVSAAMHGSELRIAETRAVNRALRKAYGIGLCSVEELGSTPVPPSNGNAKNAPARFGTNLEVITPVPLRDQLRQIIRHHKLDPVLTKSYALEHLQLKSLRDATRDQVSELVDHFQRRLFEDRDGLLQDLAKLSNPDQGKEVA